MQLLHLSKCASITWRLEWERELCAEITFSDFLGIAMPMPMPMQCNANGKENYMQMSPFPMCTAIAMDRKSSCCPYWQSIQMYRLKFPATENEFINHLRNWTFFKCIIITQYEKVKNFLWKIEVFFICVGFTGDL